MIIISQGMGQKQNESLLLFPIKLSKALVSSCQDTFHPPIQIETKHHDSNQEMKSSGHRLHGKTLLPTAHGDCPAKTPPKSALPTCGFWGVLLPLVLPVFYGDFLRIPLEFCCPPRISLPGNSRLFSLPNFQKRPRLWDFSFLQGSSSSFKFHWIWKFRIHQQPYT